MCWWFISSLLLWEVAYLRSDYYSVGTVVLQ